MFEVNRRWTIDGSSRRNLGRYLNHSCRPNAVAVLRNGRMIFVALRAIAPGEEITLDYGEEYVELFIAGSGCRCAACQPTARLTSAAATPRGIEEQAVGVDDGEERAH
jgi:SET domain-containing protein